MSPNNLDYLSESIKINEIDEKRLQTQLDITRDDEEKAKERIHTSDIHQDAQAIAQNIANAEKTSNEIHLVDITQVLKSPAGHEKFKIVLTEGKIKFSFLEKVGFLTNFGKQFFDFFANKSCQMAVDFPQKI